MKITQAILDKLTEEAKASPRLRMNLDLRNGEEDSSQRMLNAIEPGSPLPIHRHQKTSETIVCLRGRLVEDYYDELERRCTEAIELSPNGPVVALNIPAGQWHTVKALESGTVILEMKNGPYEHLRGQKISWSNARRRVPISRRGGSHFARQRGDLLEWYGRVVGLLALEFR